MMAAEGGARRRIVRDLHDGVQQRLVNTILTLELVQRALAGGEDTVDELVAEVLTNVLKHSQASSAEVRVALDDGRLNVEIRDDGIGGADPEGHRLAGIGDRVILLGGSLRVDSPPGGGTGVSAAIPVAY